MKPARFDYHSPSTPAEAVEILAHYEGDARLLAGGQSLVPLLNFRVLTPSALIDLNRCAGLDTIRLDADRLVFGTMVRQAAAENSELVKRYCPLIGVTMPFLGSRTIRNRGTIGGTLAHADRSAELPAVAVALGATMVIDGPRGQYQVPAQDFYLGDLSTVLEPEEMLREIHFPIAPDGHRYAFVEASNRHHDTALVGVAVNLTMAEDRCVQAAIAVIGVTAPPQRLSAVEDQLRNNAIDPQICRVASQASIEGIEIEGDLNAPAEYRRQILPGLVERALNEAMNRQL